MIVASSYTDGAGNPGAGAASANYAVDTRPPVFTSGAGAAVPESTASTAARTRSPRAVTGPAEIGWALTARPRDWPSRGTASDRP